MLRKLIIIVAVMAVFAACGYMLARHQSGQAAPVASGAPARIVSLSPSLTEALFALGLGDNVIGVTRYCDYPAAVHGKQVIGGYFDHNYELIMHLKPDLVFAMEEQTKSVEQFQKLGVPVAVLGMYDVDGILEALRQMGAMTGKEARAAELTAAISARMAHMRELTRDVTPVKTLLCVGRSMGGASLRDVHAAGSGTYIGMLLEHVGGVNVYDGAAAYPALTTEAVIRLNPAVIMEMVPEVQKGLVTTTEIVDQWMGLEHIEAVQKHNIHVLTGSYTTVPGVRMVLLMEDMLQILHPELGYVKDAGFAELLENNGDFE